MSIAIANPTAQFRPGSLVSARGREWVVLPGGLGVDLLRLRPLGGTEEDSTLIYLPLEPVAPSSATFPPPDPEKTGAQAAALLLRDALRLKLRAGAGPFRSFGNIAVEPRAYQLVPLLMALKMDTVRLLIADDVGIGKTIEGALIARELLDRGEISRIAVLCPPHLCDQWHGELAAKFSIQSEVVRTGTAGRLERGLPQGQSIFDVYPFTVVSLDYIKSDRRRDEFLRACPEFVIIEEAHASVGTGADTKNQRLTLLRGLAQRPDRHMVFLTATPHSGDESAFHNLLALLHADFRALQGLPDGPIRQKLRERLALQFVQRRRADIAEWRDAGSVFPDRETKEATYSLSGDWGRLFDEVLDYARTMVKRAEGQSALRQRMSWWAALALLRCVSSSPASATVALTTRLRAVEGTSESDQITVLDEQGAEAVFDGAATDSLTSEEAAPAGLTDDAEASPEDSRALRSLLDRAEALRGPNRDPKLRLLITRVHALLAEGFRPVIFCRFIQTAHYVGEHLSAALDVGKHHVEIITGQLSPEDRRARIDDLASVTEGKTPVLVATDCLSEGINLQAMFSAVVHYDLSWNPTRHEQREGRVDRFGQPEKIVRALMIYGDNNPVDGAVLKVTRLMNALLPLGLPAQRATPTTGTMETAFTAIRVEGGLFPAEFLQRVAKPDSAQKLDASYGVPPGRTLRDEIGRYWTIADALWREYKRDRERSDLPAERVAIERWLTRLLRDVLGYADLTKVSAAQVGERGFPIRHRAQDGAVPLLLTTQAHDLDRSHSFFGDEGRRRAPHAAMQEYLNAEATALWGVVANGNRLRLLRDNPSLTRPAYVEADLERIFEEGLYPDFAAFWLIAHATRVTPDNGGMAGCWLERWRAEGAKTGQRALERLRAGVTTALRELGSGFVEHPQNEALRVGLRDGSVTAEILHQQLLRLVYRLLFLFTAEERGLLHAPEATPEARALYAQGYGLARLRDRARRRRYYDGYADLWTGLTVTFRALARGAAPLGVPALGGLFEEDQCAALDTAALPNARLLSAIHALAFFEDKGSLQRVNYRDMGTEELGSVYESLLELHPVVQVATRPWTFAFAGDEAGGTVKGSERKLSGSYYTPDSLVQELLRSALDPVIERALRDNPTDPRGALLRLRVLDPACGSGHFLLGAARRLADAVARLDMEGDLPDEAARRRALREVVRRCIFGVDRNPLSVELCRTALWIEAIEPGKPLSFLDAHIKCGDSLIGVADLKVLKAGIPDEAFKELTGDDKAYCRDLRKQNKGERDNPVLTLLPEVALPPDLAAAIAALTDAPEDTLAAVQEKRRALRQVTEGRAAHDLRVACDLWCAAFFASKATRPEMRGRDMVPTTDTVWRYLRAPSSVYGPLVGAVEEMRGRLRFFHWPLEFPEAFAAGGFDCLLGNPPWERIKVQEQEFFASRHPVIARASNAAARRKLIDGLAKGDPVERALYRAFEEAKRDADASGQFIRGGRFPLTAVGDVNTYALFAELSVCLASSVGHAGIVVPSGLLTDDNTKDFFGYVASTGRLARAIDFQSSPGLFAEIGHARFKFSLVTLAPPSAGRQAEFSFFIRDINHIEDPERRISLSASDIRLINPNTLTCPIFRSSRDADLTKRIYERVPVLIDEARGTEGNPWGISFLRMLDMANDSGLFRDAAQLVAAGAQREGGNWRHRDGSVMMPLYEAKMIQHFDHRFGTFEQVKNRPLPGVALPEPSEFQRRDPSYTISPWYWVPEAEVTVRLQAKSWSRKWLTGWRDIARSADFRTLINGIIPVSGVGHKFLLFFPKSDVRRIAALSGCLSSLVCDYIARQKIGGTSFTYFLFRQLAVPRPNAFSEVMLEFLVPRIIELTYTAEDMRPWAEDLGHVGPPFIWDEQRRAFLRAELDAAYAHLYGMTRDELRYVLDPTDVYGPEFPSETFRVLKEREVKEFDEYRTAQLVLKAWDRLTADGTFQGWSR